MKGEGSGNEVAEGFSSGQTREDIIRDYLISIAAQARAPEVITGTGDFVFGVKPEPMTLRDVGKAAENFFRTKEK